MKIALDYVQPFTFAALRTFLGAVALFIVLPLLKRPLRPKAFWPTALLGVLQTTGFVGLLTWALEDGGAGKTSILTYTMPFWLLLMAWVVLGEKLKGFQWVAVGLALAGLDPDPCALAAGGQDQRLPGGGRGAVLGGQRRLREDPAQAPRGRPAVADRLADAAGLASRSSSSPPPPGRARRSGRGTFIAALVFVAILGNALAWILWLYILNSFRAGTAGLATLLTPVIGISRPGSSWASSRAGRGPGDDRHRGGAAPDGRAGSCSEEEDHRDDREDGDEHRYRVAHVAEERGHLDARALGDALDGEVGRVADVGVGAHHDRPAGDGGQEVGGREAEAGHHLRR